MKRFIIVMFVVKLVFFVEKTTYYVVYLTLFNI